MALFLEVEPGDEVRIGSTTVVRMERKSGQRARLRIQSEDDVHHVKPGEEPDTETPNGDPPFTRRQA